MLSLLQTSMCNYFVILDDDVEGNRAFQEAERSLLVNQANTKFTKCLGLHEAEFEDLLDEKVYADYFQVKYSVDVTTKAFKAKKKWTDRIRQGLIKSGNSWLEAAEHSDKEAIAKRVAGNPGGAVHVAKLDVLNAIVKLLEDKLNVIASRK
jgi:hypothetical protein